MAFIAREKIREVFEQKGLDTPIAEVINIIKDKTGQTVGYDNVKGLKTIMRKEKGISNERTKKKEGNAPSPFGDHLDSIETFAKQFGGVSRLRDHLDKMLNFK